MTLTLSRAMAGFIHYKIAAGKSPYTIRNYRTTFAKLQNYLGTDPPLAAIERSQLIDFFAWLQEEYVSKPGGIATGQSVKLGAKTILNIHADLSSLWHWAVDEDFVEINIVRTIESPNAKSPPVDPFTQKDIEALLGVCERKASHRAGDERHAAIAERNHLIILLLVDTGLRAQELCDITRDDMDMSANKIRVRGKGDKERVVYFGKRTAKALWRYITPRLSDGECRLFTVGPADDPRPLPRLVLRQTLLRIGQRAGVANVYPHRFRHTFAITYLRNGGDLFTLQDLLGHSDLAMVRRYARIAQADCARAHQKASPVDNWRL